MKSYRLTMLCGLLLGSAAVPAAGLDPATVQGHLVFGAQRYELRYAQAVSQPENPQRLWILLTTTELSAADAADAARTLKLATSGELRGVRLAVAAADPQVDVLQGALLLSKEESPSGEIVFAAGAEKYWDRLTVGDKRIVGALRYGVEASSFSDTPAWSLQVNFDAPIFSGR